MTLLLFFFAASNPIVRRKFFDKIAKDKRFHPTQSPDGWYGVEYSDIIKYQVNHFISNLVSFLCIGMESSVILPWRILCKSYLRSVQ